MDRKFLLGVLGVIVGGLLLPYSASAQGPTGICYYNTSNPSAGCVPVTTVRPLPVLTTISRYTPKGFCTLGSLAASQLLSSCAGGIPTGANYAVICAVSQGVNWRDDGVAPTAANGGGMPLVAGSCFAYNADMTALRFIQTASSAVINVSFYQGT